MNRRNFIQKTMATCGGFAFSSSIFSGILSQNLTNQKFNFMNDSHPNLKLINAFFQAYGRHDIEAIKGILEENIKWHIPGNHPLSGTKTGVDEVLEFFGKLNKAALKAEPIVMGVNDNFVIDCHRNWSNLEDGNNLDSMSCLLWKIEQNKIVEVHNFPADQQVVDLFFMEHYK
ncbi:nuclear transport factor 2 family protein [Flexithrix dorotheae]|uniref:nuclear transport factor 2 family protein n=1 Tax=Flexithrix dorotheae TaxID=70993 RepID=UPI00036DF794|nr:nuclear transport factor 2 family protein [Flexithrix dorotheae]